MRKLILVLTILFLLVVSILNGLSFKILGYRSYSGQLNRVNTQRLGQLITLDSSISEQEIQNIALNYTTDNLHFALQKNSLKDPNQILVHRKAHCKMYAYVYTSAYNHLAKINNLTSNSRVGYGQFYLFGINLHQFIESTFFRDHDVCVILNTSGELQIIDPLLYDYFFIRNFN